ATLLSICNLRFEICNGFSRAHSSRASAFRQAPGAGTFSRGRLAVRGHHRDLHPAPANDAAAGERRRAVQADHVNYTAALRDAARRAFAKALPGACRSFDRSGGARTEAKLEQPSPERARPILFRTLLRDPALFCR